MDLELDLDSLLTELLEAQMQWKYIGGALGLEAYEIAAIDEKCKDAKDALREMLTIVLQRRSVTRKLLTEVLSKSSIKLTKLAAKVSNPRSQDDSIDSETPARKKRKQDDSPDSGQIKRIKSGDVLKTPGRLEPPYKYTMTNQLHGNALIINNVNYKTPLTVRKGSNEDKKELKKALETLGYAVESVDDLPTADDIKTTVVEHANKNSNPDSFICCILAHGEEGAIVGLDGSTIKIAEISRALVEPPNPCQKYLHQKPKIFFIQACQGRDTPSELDCTKDVPTDPSLPVENLDTGIPSLPRDSDFFYGFASSFETAATRNPDHGASYIQTLCNVLETHYKDEDLVTMVTRVHFKEAENPHNIGNTKPLYRQQPQLVSTLRGQVKFN
ncbi:caspase-7-like isoform X3 [Halichondria panicea]|uniref:caspase-7-like isoform X3 n=1 Tax=Halichondria panicea TaxID=6063 RepID=UPI00312B498C